MHRALGKRKLAERKEETFQQGNWPGHGVGGTQGIEGDRGGSRGCSVPEKTQADGGDRDFEVTLEYEQREQDRYPAN